MAAETSKIQNIHNADYYSILGVSSTVRLNEIKRAFRMLQRQAHPDSSKTAATRHISAKLNEAYQALSNPLSRLEYDLQHGFKQKTEENLSKLEEYKRRKAKKLRENLSASAQRSRDIESNVTSTFSDGTIIKNCGLIISKAKYGLIDMERRSRALTLNKRQHLSSFARSVSLSTGNNRRSFTRSLSNAGYDSEKENVAHITQKNKHKKTAPAEYTIDVTDAVQCIVTHRGQNGGFIEIEASVDKSTLDGFYVPSAITKNRETRYLEIEYLFNRKYHYIRVNNFDYLCIPNKSHIVHIFDAKDPYKSIGRTQFAEDTEEDHEIETVQEEEEEKTESIELDTNLPKLTTMSRVMERGEKQSHVISISNEIIALPSGKLARKSRPSLVGLPKFSEIESLRNEDTKNNERKKKMYHVIKWSVGLMVIGAIGGLSYYLADKARKHNHNRNEDKEGVVAYWWSPQESFVLYIQRYWNWICGMNTTE